MSDRLFCSEMSVGALRAFAALLNLHQWYIKLRTCEASAIGSYGGLGPRFARR